MKRIMKKVFILLTVVCICLSCCSSFAQTTQSPYGDTQILRHEWFDYEELYSTAEYRAIATWLAAIELDLYYDYDAIDVLGETYVGYLNGSLYVTFPNPNPKASHCYLTIGFLSNNRYVRSSDNVPFPRGSHIKNDVDMIMAAQDTVREIIDILCE